MEKLDETFDGLSPEYNQLVAYQTKINQLISRQNKLEEAVRLLTTGLDTVVGTLGEKEVTVTRDRINQILQ